jgi:hypothetical protein
MPLPSSLPGQVTVGRVAELPAERISTGNPRLDELLDGGFPCGRLTEIFGPVSSGRTSLLYSVLAEVTSGGRYAALIDPGDSFDPVRAKEAGVVLSALLWIRPSDPVQAFRSVEIVLDTRGFSLVALDLADLFFSQAAILRSGTAWARLSRRVSGTRAALLLLGGRRLAAGFAHLCLALSAARPLWCSRWFDGFETRVEVIRAGNGSVGRSVQLRFGNAPLRSLRGEKRS